MNPPARKQARKPRIAIIAALARNRTIGRAQALPWRLPEDLRRFRALTMGHPIIMGRKTWESLGRPLPGRRNLVVSRRGFPWAEGCEAYATLRAAIASCSPDDGEIFVIGGAALYALALPLAARMYLTEINADIEGDAFFPEFDRAQWRECARSPGTGEAPFRYEFATYERVDATQSTK